MLRVIENLYSSYLISELFVRTNGTSTFALVQLSRINRFLRFKTASNKSLKISSEQKKIWILNFGDKILFLLADFFKLPSSVLQKLIFSKETKQKCFSWPQFFGFCFFCLSLFDWKNLKNFHQGPSNSRWLAAFPLFRVQETPEASFLEFQNRLKRCLKMAFHFHLKIIGELDCLQLKRNFLMYLVKVRWKGSGKK